MTYSVIPIVNSVEEGKLFLTKASEFMEDYYKALIDQGLLEHAYFDGSAKTGKDFVNISLSSIVLFSFIFDNSSEIDFPIGHVCLTNFTGYCAMAHFNILRPYHQKAVEVGKEGLEVIKRLKRKDKTPFICNLLGITPVTNRAARLFARRIGFEPIAILNKACHMYYKNKHVDGVLSVLRLNE